MPPITSAELALWVPRSSEDKDVVLAQVGKLVSHPALKSSKRCPALLRYIVEHQLRCDSGKLKERMIGSDLFGRESDYDCGSDPVVRTTANDLRKRIAQYYHERGHESELRIDLPPGSYLAEFHLPEDAPQKLDFGSVSHGVASVAVSAQEDKPARAWLMYALLGCLFVGIASAIVWSRPVSANRSLNRFWRPLAESGPVLVSVGTWDVSSINSNSPPTMNSNVNLLPMSDALAFSQVTAYLSETRTPFRVQNARSTTLADLTQGPVVVIGAIDNQWSLRVTDPLRFHFVARDAQPKWAIADRRNGTRQFVNNGPLPAPGDSKDYAIIGRISDQTSGQISVIVAGLGAAGTTAASEFVTNAHYMDALAQRDARALSAKNIEAVISVDVVDGKPGAPQIEGIEAW